jgi:hypothetical protein
MFADRVQDSNRAAAGALLDWHPFTCFIKPNLTISAAINSTLWRQPLDGLLTCEHAKYF